jgi:4'-phosphopantetheinyl transferase
VSIELIYFQNEAGKPKVAIASIKEEIDTNHSLFTSSQLLQAAAIRNIQYKRQWLGTRLLLKEMDASFEDIVYDENGKPFIANSKHELSISHTSNFCAICIDELPTGIDIEIIGPKVSRISSRFLSESEKEFVNTNLMEHIVWGAKEAIFKAWSQGNVDFSKDIITEPFSYSGEGLITARFKQRVYKIRYKKLAELMLVYIENS